MTMFQRARFFICAILIPLALCACTSFNKQDDESAGNDLEQMEFDKTPKVTPTVATDEGGGSMAGETSLTDIRYVSRRGGGTVVIEASAPVTFRTRENKEQNQFIVDVANSKLPDRLKRPYITKDFNQSISSINAYQDGGSATAHIVVQFRSATRATVTQSGKRLIVFSSGNSSPNVSDVEEIDSLARTAALEGGPGDARILPQDSEAANANTFYGKPISIEVRDTSVRDVIQLISEQSGANIVLASGIEGNISLKLKQIPWDQALMIVMKSQGLGYVRQGSVLRISSLKALKDENEAAKQILEAQLAAEPLKVKIIPVSYASVTDLVARVSPFLTKVRGAVVADTRTSSLVITDTPEIIERVTNLVKALDTPPLQVMIEGKVVEARDTFTRDYGIKWGFSGQQTKLGHPFEGQSIMQNNLQITAGAPNQTMAYNIRLGTFDIFGDLDAALQLAESENLAKVVSSPRISTLNNEPANITQAQNIFLPQQSIVNGIIQQTLTAVPVKLSLDVTPQVTSQGDILMSLNIVREFVGALPPGSTSTQPPIESRTAKTKIMVRNGQTAVVGGVYQSDAIDSTTGVPWLRSIPVIGWLFKSKSTNNTKTELLVFLTPRIINTDDSAPKENTL